MSDHNINMKNFDTVKHNFEHEKRNIHLSKPRGAFPNILRTLMLCENSGLRKQMTLI